MGGAHQGGGRGIPPTSIINHDTAGPGSMGSGGTGSGGGGAGQRLTGKAERTIGNLVGSSALQAKGAQKEREAGVTKLQGRELAEAERLENEALMRRERVHRHGRAHVTNDRPSYDRCARRRDLTVWYAKKYQRCSATIRATTERARHRQSRRDSILVFDAGVRRRLG